jgi:hypothetical protein
MKIFFSGDGEDPQDTWKRITFEDEDFQSSLDDGEKIEVWYAVGFRVARWVSDGNHPERQHLRESPAHLLLGVPRGGAVTAPPVAHATAALSLPPPPPSAATHSGPPSLSIMTVNCTNCTPPSDLFTYPPTPLYNRIKALIEGRLSRDPAFHPTPMFDQCDALPKVARSGAEHAATVIEAFREWVPVVKVLPAMFTSHMPTRPRKPLCSKRSSQRLQDSQGAGPRTGLIPAPTQGHHYLA